MSSRAKVLGKEEKQNGCYDTVSIAKNGEKDANEDSNEDKAVIRANHEMCHFCFDTLINELIPATTRRNRSLGHSCSRRSSNNSSNTSEAPTPSYMDPLPPATKCPLFITWDKRRNMSSSSYSYSPSTTPRSVSTNSLSSSSSSNNTNEKNSMREEDYDLRGCIGTLSPRPLKTAIQEYAITSAFRDRRFDPISRHELPFLRVGVSLLVNYEECKNCYDWVVGVHGILINFSHGSSYYTATYLPEVTLEQGWDQEESINSLVQKAGFRGDINKALINKIKCTRYQSSKMRMSYQEYVAASGSDPLKSIEASPPSTKRSWRNPFTL